MAEHARDLFIIAQSKQNSNAIDISQTVITANAVNIRCALAARVLIPQSPILNIKVEGKREI